METYTRMLDKRKKPTPEAVDRYIGLEGARRLQALEAWLTAHYNLERNLRFPFGNNYGWGYKYSHGKKHLCYAFFEEGAFTVTLQLGDLSVACVEEKLPQMSEQARTLWSSRYPCGEHGGWIHYRVLTDEALDDIYAFIACKVPPKK